MPLKDKAKRKAYMKEYHAMWYEKHKEKRIAQIAEYEKTKPNEWRKAISQKAHFKKRYNITPQEYEAMLEAQNNQCAICNKYKDLPSTFNLIKSILNSIKSFL